MLKTSSTENQQGSLRDPSETIRQAPPKFFIEKSRRVKI